MSNPTGQQNLADIITQFQLQAENNAMIISDSVAENPTFHELTNVIPQSQSQSQPQQIQQNSIDQGNETHVFKTPLPVNHWMYHQKNLRDNSQRNVQKNPTEATHQTDLNLKSDISQNQLEVQNLMIDHIDQYDQGNGVVIYVLQGPPPEVKHPIQQANSHSRDHESDSQRPSGIGFMQSQLLPIQNPAVFQTDLSLPRQDSQFQVVAVNQCVPDEVQLVEVTL
jgi:hypothetical protein